MNLPYILTTTKKELGLRLYEEEGVLIKGDYTRVIPRKT